MTSHAFDGGSVKQIGAVTQGGPKPVTAVMSIQVQIKVSRAAFPSEVFETQLRECRRIDGGSVGLVIEHHLKQRVEAQAALRLQRLHQLLERQVLMSLGFQGAQTYLSQ